MLSERVEQPADVRSQIANFLDDSVRGEGISYRCHLFDSLLFQLFLRFELHLSLFPGAVSVFGYMSSISALVFEVESFFGWPLSTIDLSPLC